MSVEIRLIDDPDLALMFFSGLVTRGDLAATVRAVLAGEIDLRRNLLGYFAPGADLREISTDEIIEHRDAVRAAAEEKAPGARVRSALVSCSTANTPILELWAFYCAADPNYPIDVRNVEDLSQAADWLSIDARQLDRLRTHLTHGRG